MSQALLFYEPTHYQQRVYDIDCTAVNELCVISLTSRDISIHMSTFESIKSDERGDLRI